MKGYQYRWFTLNPETGKLEYFEVQFVFSTPSWILCESAADHLCHYSATWGEIHKWRDVFSQSFPLPVLENNTLWKRTMAFITSLTPLCDLGCFYQRLSSDVSCDKKCSQWFAINNGKAACVTQFHKRRDWTLFTNGKPFLFPCCSNDVSNVWKLFAGNESCLLVERTAAVFPSAPNYSLGNKWK